MPADFRIHAEVGSHIRVPDLGINVYVGLNDDGQPTISIGTEEMPAEYVYDEKTGLPGTAEPYTYKEDEDWPENIGNVFGPGGDLVARHYADGAVSARMAAREHCIVLNASWHTRCGMPDVQVLMGDSTLYDSEDHNPELHARRRARAQEA